MGGGVHAVTKLIIVKYVVAIILRLCVLCTDTKI